MAYVVLVIACVVLATACITLGGALWRLHSQRDAARVGSVHLEAQLRHVETETLRLEAVRRDFVANISHELRTPLASIKLLVETLESGALDDYEVALNFTHRIGEETNHLIGMAEELLDLARLEAAPTMHPRHIDAATLVAQAVERMRAIARNKGVTLKTDVPAKLPALWADSEGVGRVFVNLLNNAVNFTPPGGTVSVRALPRADEVMFSVEDTGPGIPKGEEHRIFERFYKVDSSRQRGGVGLGLSITRHILEAQGGRIWARNRDDGPGARFSFTLPTVAQSLAEGVATPHANGALSTG